MCEEQLASNIGMFMVVIMDRKLCCQTSKVQSLM